MSKVKTVWIHKDFVIGKQPEELRNGDQCNAFINEVPGNVKQHYDGDEFIEYELTPKERE